MEKEKGRNTLTFIIKSHTVTASVHSQIQLMGSNCIIKIQVLNTVELWIVYSMYDLRGTHPNHSIWLCLLKGKCERNVSHT